MVNRCTGCLMEISIEPGNYRTGRGRKPSARERVRRRARAETKAEERAVENRSRCVGQLDASRDLARPAKAQSGGRARRGEVASVERAPSCSKPKSMATGMSSRPSLSTGSSDPRHAAPHEGQQGDEQEEKSATRHLPIACVALASDAMPRPHEAAGEEAGRIRRSSFLRPNAHTRRSNSIGAREPRPHSTRVSRVSDRPNHRTCPNLSPPSGGRDLCARHNERLVRLPEQIRREPTPGDRGRGASLPTRARSAERASDRPASTDVIV